MNRISIISLSIFLIMISSCSKNHWEERLSEKIEGHWTYEKAKYQAKTFSREDRIHEFKNDHIYFYKDGTLEIINEIDSIYLKGIYSFERTTNLNNNWDNNNGSASATVYQVQISLTDTATNNLYQELWDQFSITKKVIRYQIEEDARPFYFKLCKQDT